MGKRKTKSTKSRKAAKTTKKTRVKVEAPLPVRIPDEAPAAKAKAERKRRQAPGERHDGGLLTTWCVQFNGEDKPEPTHSVRGMCEILKKRGINVRREGLRGFIRRCRAARQGTQTGKELKQQYRSFRPFLQPVVGIDAKGKPIYGEPRDDFGVKALGPAVRPDVPTGEYRIAENLMDCVPEPPKPRKSKGSRAPVPDAAAASDMIDVPPPPPPAYKPTGGVKKEPETIEVSSDGSSSSSDEEDYDSA